MPAVDDVQFDTSGWELRADALEDRRIWDNQYGDVLTLRFMPGTPRFPSLFRLQALRDYYAQQVAAGGGCILSVDLLHVKGVDMGKLLFKSPQPAGGWGYMASLCLAYQDFSYTLRIQTVETEQDAERGQFVWNWLQETHPDHEDYLALWFGRSGVSDTSSAQPCLADDARWDEQFPLHPLSRLRVEIARLVPTLAISRDVKNSQLYR